MLQYLPYLEREGVKYRLLYTYPNKYFSLPSIIKALKPVYYILGGLLTFLIAFQRLIQILVFAWRYDVVVFQRDLLFRVPSAFLERLAKLMSRRGTRFIFDVDDSVFLTKLGSRSATLDRKFAQICSGAKVIAGNEYLAEYFRQFTEVVVVPTTVDTSREIKDSKAVGDSIVIGWTGVATNLGFLKELLPVFEELLGKYRFKLLVISDATEEELKFLKSIPFEAVKWRAETEAEDLRRIDIGIMPLSDNGWSKGKCGYKLLQYMSVGIASVASPVGVNQLIVKHGTNGFLASTNAEWSRALAELIENQPLRETFGKAGRDTVQREYSIDYWGPRWANILCGRE